MFYVPSVPNLRFCSEALWASLHNVVCEAKNHHFRYCTSTAVLTNEKYIRYKGRSSEIKTFPWDASVLISTNNCKRKITFITNVLIILCADYVRWLKI